MTTAPAGTKINGGAYTVPAVIGGRAFHLFSDFLLHDVGTGDGIAVQTIEHYGRSARQMPKECSPENFHRTQNRVRTAPLWGLRLRSRLMHDGASVTLRDDVLRHGGARQVKPPGIFENSQPRTSYLSWTSSAACESSADLKSGRPQNHLGNPPGRTLLIVPLLWVAIPLRPHVNHVPAPIESGNRVIHSLIALLRIHAEPFSRGT
jgi:hypothetical protein